MAIIDTGSSTAGKANVDASYQLAVTTNTDATKAGYFKIAQKSMQAPLLVWHLVSPLKPPAITVYG